MNSSMVGYNLRRREEVEISDSDITKLNDVELLDELMVLDRRLNHFPAGVAALTQPEKVGWLNRLSSRRANLTLETLKRMNAGR